MTLSTTIFNGTGRSNVRGGESKLSRRMPRRHRQQGRASRHSRQRITPVLSRTIALFLSFDFSDRGEKRRGRRSAFTEGADYQQQRNQAYYRTGRPAPIVGRGDGESGEDTSQRKSGARTARPGTDSQELATVAVVFHRHKHTGRAEQPAAHSQVPAIIITAAR